MKILASVGMALLYLLASTTALAQAASASSDVSASGGVPLSRLISFVAKKTGKRFVVDPRVQAEVQLVGQDPSSVSYSELLSILQLYGFAAVEGSGYVRLAPDATVRSMALPFVTAKDNRPDAEYVGATIAVRTMPAAELVPILRPLLPQQAFLAAATCSNNLIMVSTFDKFKQIEALVHTIDTGEPYKIGKCEGREAAGSRDAAK
jgi:general secretion pathway protein D